MRRPPPRRTFPPLCRRRCRRRSRLPHRRKDPRACRRPCRRRSRRNTFPTVVVLHAALEPTVTPWITSTRSPVFRQSYTSRNSCSAVFILVTLAGSSTDLTIPCRSCLSESTGLTQTSFESIHFIIFLKWRPVSVNLCSRSRRRVALNMAAPARFSRIQSLANSPA